MVIVTTWNRTDNITESDQMEKLIMSYFEKKYVDVQTSFPKLNIYLMEKNSLSLMRRYRF